MSIYNSLPISKVSLVYNNLGALNETDTHKGVHHLMEHLITKQYQTIKNEMQKFDIYSNAFTSSEDVNFEFVGLRDNLEKFAGKLSELITNGTPVSEEVFNNEKKVIFQEIGMRYNSPIDKACAHFLKEIYNYFTPSGPQDGRFVESFSYDEYLEMQKTCFKDPLILEVGPQKFLYHPSNVGVEKKNIPFKKTIKENFFDYSSQNSSPQKTIIFGSNFVCTDPIEGMILNFSIKILTEGLLSPMYQELRNKNGLVYYVGGSLDEFYALYPSFVALTDKKDEVIKIMKHILNNVSEFISEERIQIIRENLKYKEIKNEILRYNNTHRIKRECAGYYTTAICYDSITKEGIIETLNKYFANDNAFVFVE